MKRYQVFVSSTFRDLEDERMAVISALLHLDAIPSGMEMLPVADDDAWTLIQRVINDCDYYLLIIGGRYGSVDDASLSFTEREYDYAAQLGKPVMAFLHRDPGAIAAAKTDEDDDLRQRLLAFRAKVEAHKHCKYWTSAEGLVGQVALSFHWFVENYEAEGWVRGSQALTPDLEGELKELRLRVRELRVEARAEAARTTQIQTETFASGEKTIEVPLTFDYIDNEDVPCTYSGKLTITWDELFAAVGHSMFKEASEDEIQNALRNDLYYHHFDKSLAQDLRQVRSISAPALVVVHQLLVQFFALGLVEESKVRHPISDTNAYWSLTQEGKAHLAFLTAFKADGSGGHPKRTASKKASTKTPAAKKTAAKEAAPNSGA